ncbi:MAG: hypothetical protein Q9191_004890 [Dirinaria sp. TL-2023a]
MMDPFEELERMAVKANDESASSDDEPSLEQVANWQRIFHYSRTQAISKFKEHRANIARPSIPDELWDSMQTRLKGYDREAYEHELLLDHQSSFRSASPMADERSSGNALFLFKLGKAHLNEPLSTISEVQHAAQMPSIPKSFTGVDEDDDEATFCQLDATAKKHISSYLVKMESRFQPTFVAYSQAKKDLSEYSAYPMLGADTTLPQHRLQSGSDFVLPKQGQYPVTYFFLRRPRSREA